MEQSALLLKGIPRRHGVAELELPVRTSDMRLERRPEILVGPANLFDEKRAVVPETERVDAG